MKGIEMSDVLSGEQKETVNMVFTAEEQSSKELSKLNEKVGGYTATIWAWIIVTVFCVIMTAWNITSIKTRVDIIEASLTKDEAHCTIGSVYTEYRESGSILYACETGTWKEWKKE
jgi:hypothetical protein